MWRKVSCSPGCSHEKLEITEKCKGKVLQVLRFVFDDDHEYGDGESFEILNM